jgi:hypothetical protein
MKRLLVCIALLAILPAFAQSPEAPPQNSAATATNLTVADVISLHQADVSDSVVVARLSQQKQPMSLSTDDLIQLKKAGVTDVVVQAMLAAPAAPKHVVVTNQSLEKLHSMNPTGATPPYAPGTPPDPNDPMAPHDSGIYLATTDAAGKQTLTFMDRAGIAGVKMNVGAVFTFFADPVKVRYEVPPAKSSIRTNSTNPVFYFYFDDKSAGLGKAPFAAAKVSSPTQFQLEQFATSKKERDLTGMKFGIFSGVSDGEKHIAFNSERLRTGLYRVTVTQPLKPGEYAIVNPPPPSNQQDPQNGPRPDIFDFGVDAPTSPPPSRP